MKYEDVQKLRTKYRQDPEVIYLEEMRNVAVRCGNFKKAFEFSFIILAHDNFHKNM